MVAIDKGCHEFSDVKHATSANTHYAVCLELAGYFKDGLEVVDCRLCQNVLEYFDVDANLAEGFQRLFYQRTDGGSRQHK